MRNNLLFDALWLLPLGVFVGTVGTLIGAGGGFILVPVLLLLYPNEAPATITTISLIVVFLQCSVWIVGLRPDQKNRL